MEDNIKDAVIKLFESQSKNFQKSLKKEFNKNLNKYSDETVLVIYKDQKIRIQKIVDALKPLYGKKINFRLVEKILFNHLLSE